MKPMKTEAVLKEFRNANALLEGHFTLSSGKHARLYLQCARVFMDAKRAGRLCRALAKKVRAVIGEVDMVVSPAMGGVIVGHEMGRALGVPAMFLERVEGTFQLRRGFDIRKNARVLMVEDVITTGLSSKEAIKAIRAHGGKVIGGACVIDRSGGKAKIGIKLVSLAEIFIETFDPDRLPDDLRHMPAIKPGSRDLPKNHNPKA